MGRRNSGFKSMSHSEGCSRVRALLGYPPGTFWSLASTMAMRWAMGNRSRIRQNTHSGYEQAPFSSDHDPMLETASMARHPSDRVGGMRPSPAHCAHRAYLGGLRAGERGTGERERGTPLQGIKLKIGRARPRSTGRGHRGHGDRGSVTCSCKLRLGLRRGKIG
jgi:hypothetical protein